MLFTDIEGSTSWSTGSATATASCSTASARSSKVHAPSDRGSSSRRARPPALRRVRAAGRGSRGGRGDAADPEPVVVARRRRGSGAGGHAQRLPQTVRPELRRHCRQHRLVDLRGGPRRAGPRVRRHQVGTTRGRRPPAFDSSAWGVIDCVACQTWRPFASSPPGLGSALPAAVGGGATLRPRRIQCSGSRRAASTHSHRRGAHDQLRIEEDLLVNVGLVRPRLGEQQFGGGAPQQFPGLPDRAQRHGGRPGELDVVVADDRQLRARDAAGSCAGARRGRGGRWRRRRRSGAARREAGEPLTGAPALRDGRESAVGSTEQARPAAGAAPSLAGTEAVGHTWRAAGRRRRRSPVALLEQMVTASSPPSTSRRRRCTSPAPDVDGRRATGTPGPAGRSSCVVGRTA